MRLCTIVLSERIYETVYYSMLQCLVFISPAFSSIVEAIVNCSPAVAAAQCAISPTVGWFMCWRMRFSLPSLRLAIFYFAMEPIFCSSPTVAAPWWTNHPIRSFLPAEESLCFRLMLSIFLPFLCASTLFFYGGYCVIFGVFFGGCRMGPDATWFEIGSLFYRAFIFKWI